MGHCLFLLSGELAPLRFDSGGELRRCCGYRTLQGRGLSDIRGRLRLRQRCLHPCLHPDLQLRLCVLARLRLRLSPRELDCGSLLHLGACARLRHRCLHLGLHLRLSQRHRLRLGGLDGAHHRFFDRVDNCLGPQIRLLERRGLLLSKRAHALLSLLSQALHPLRPLLARHPHPLVILQDGRLNGRLRRGLRLEQLVLCCDGPRPPHLELISQPSCLLVRADRHRVRRRHHRPLLRLDLGGCHRVRPHPLHLHPHLMGLGLGLLQSSPQRTAVDLCPCLIAPAGGSPHPRASQGLNAAQRPHMIAPVDGTAWHDVTSGQPRRGDRCWKGCQRQDISPHRIIERLAAGHHALRLQHAPVVHLLRPLREEQCAERLGTA